MITWTSYVERSACVVLSPVFLPTSTGRHLAVSVGRLSDVSEPSHLGGNASPHCRSVDSSAVSALGCKVNLSHQYLKKT